VYYSTFPISKQAPKGDQLPMVAEAAEIPYGKKASVKAKPWNFRLDAVYCIAVLGYTLDGSKTAVTRSSIRNDDAPYEVFYPKLKYITIELPWFDETLPEYSLDIHLNKWLYFLNYLTSFDNIPEIFKGDPVFEKAFALAEYFNMAREERYQYERSLKRSWDAYAILTGAVEEAAEKGIEKGKIEVAQALLQKGSDLAFIAEVTGLPMDKIRGLQKT
ncbi:MAG: PD-(D/E)XK nuclease family transposase, partial [bacterium]